MLAKSAELYETNPNPQNEEQLQDRIILQRKKDPASLIDLSNRNLRGIDLSELNLRGARFREADMEDANLRNSNLTEADCLIGNFKNARLEGIQGEKAQMQMAELNNSKLQNATLCYADFRFADMEGSDLTGANLTGVDLRNANLRSAKLAGTNLTSAKLQGIRFIDIITQIIEINDQLCDDLPVQIEDLTQKLLKAMGAQLDQLVDNIQDNEYIEQLLNPVVENINKQMNFINSVPIRVELLKGILNHPIYQLCPLKFHQGLLMILQMNALADQADGKTKNAINQLRVEFELQLNLLSAKIKGNTEDRNFAFNEILPGLYEQIKKISAVDLQIQLLKSTWDYLISPQYPMTWSRRLSLRSMVLLPTLIEAKIQSDLQDLQSAKIDKNITASPPAM